MPEPHPLQCPHCSQRLHPLRDDSAAVICPHCRYASVRADGELKQQGELPMPPLKAHSFDVGEYIRLDATVFTFVAIVQSTDQEQTCYTEYELRGPDGAREYLEEDSEGGTWMRYRPLAAYEHPHAGRDSLALSGRSYGLDETYTLKVIAACGEFAQGPEIGEQYRSSFFKSDAGVVEREADVANGEAVIFSERYFRVETLSSSAIRIARSQRALIGRPEADAPVSGGSVSVAARRRAGSPVKREPGLFSKIGNGLLILVIVVSSIAAEFYDDDPSCEQQAKSAQWGDQQLQECRNTRSGRSSSYSGGK